MRPCFPTTLGRNAATTLASIARNICARSERRLFGVQRGERRADGRIAVASCRFSIAIDDFKTAERIMRDECKRWPQLRFQFACCYAMLSTINDDRQFDAVRRRIFAQVFLSPIRIVDPSRAFCRQRLSSHCVFDFWLRQLAKPKRNVQRPTRNFLLPDQILVQTIHFAFLNGFCELAAHLWCALQPTQRESVGFLCWKKCLGRSTSPQILRFLCRSLCELNSVGMARLSWDSFFRNCYLAVEVRFAVRSRL